MPALPESRLWRRHLALLSVACAALGLRDASDDLTEPPVGRDLAAEPRGGSATGGSAA